MPAGDSATTPIIGRYPPGFRARRGVNWVTLGAMYASFYMLRYNFRWATPYMAKEFGFSNTTIATILSAWALAYGTGQLVNGLFCDRIGGRLSMLIGAVGTISVNLVFGFASFAGTLSTFALIWLVNGYFQSFGAPGMVKINAAWFNRNERGTFAGIFGLMIQLGQVAINLLARFVILPGFVIGTLVVAKDDWRWLFRLPTVFAAVMAILVVLIPKETPEQAGYPGCVKDESEAGGEHSNDVRVSLKESFFTIFRHPLVWFYAVAYACTGAVRQSSDQLAVLYFNKYLHLEVSSYPAVVSWTFALIPLVAVVGSFASGVISDKLFNGHRSPVALGLYVMIGFVCAVASILMIAGLMPPTASGIFIACLAQLLVSFSVNATHSLVGTAAPMDIGGRKMAGFASGVIDSFQYYGAAIVLPISGWLIDHYGWNTWFPVMVVFGGIGAVAMLLVMRKQRLIAATAAT